MVKLELYCDENIKAKFSPPLLEWVLENLLKNALDAMSGKGMISVNVFSDKDKVILDVKDTGKGIPKSDFNTVFQPGYSTKKRGWGLGLTLSKRIIEQYHNGKIFVKESSPVGTTFRILLPS
jgi:signal transduction histidine kinase